MANSKSKELFRSFSQKTSQIVGSPGSFILAITTVVVWAVSGPFFRFSDTWQLVINTSTTIVTFLMVFLIQNSQNRDAKAMHLKLDELISSIKQARDQLVDIEDGTDEDLDYLTEEFQQLRKSQSSQ